MLKLFLKARAFIQANALKGVLALTILLAVFSAGFATSVHLNDREAVVVAQAETKTVIKTVEVIKTQIVDRAVRDLAAEKKLQTQVGELQDERDFLQRVLNEKADPDPSVSVRLGDVRMLNDAADAAVNRSDPARVAAYQEQAPSTVTLRAFVGSEIDVRVKYNELATRCDALVDWVDREIVKPQIEK